MKNSNFSDIATVAAFIAMVVMMAFAILSSTDKSVGYAERTWETEQAAVSDSIAHERSKFITHSNDQKSISWGDFSKQVNAANDAVSK